MSYFIFFRKTSPFVSANLSSNHNSNLDCAKLDTNYVWFRLICTSKLRKARALSRSLTISLREGGRKCQTSDMR